MNKRILFVSRTLRGGGAERFVSVFSSYLAEKGYDIHVLLYERHNDEYDISNMVKVYVLDDVPNTKIGKMKRIVNVKRAISDINPDVIIPFVDTVVICSYLVNIILKKEFVFTVRVSPWHEDINSTSFAKLMRKHIAKHADKIMIQTKEQGLFFSTNTLKKQFVVSNPVSPFFISNFKRTYRKEIRTIISVGRIEHQKNFQLLIEAFSKINIGNSDLKLLIYGEGKERKQLEDYIIKKGISDNCVLMGRTNKIGEVFENADLFVLSSDYEGMPNALIEAMAFGLPCISSDCKTGPKDLIKDNYNGFLFETGNVEQLIDRIGYALNNPDQMTEMGKNARKFVTQKFDINKIAIDFLNMLDNR